MKKIRFINHAEERRVKREISQEEIIDALNYPDKIESSWDDRKIYMKIFYDRELEQKMLLRVAVEETIEEIIVISVYKTSKIGKYLKGE